MPKFFVDKSDIKNNNIYIRGDSVNHIKNVLRLTIGDTLTVCDGDGYDYLAVISKEPSDCIEARVLSISDSNTEPSVDITLYQGVPKGSKMDLIIQKNVELGVKRIVPVICERTIVKLDKRDVQKKIDRWNKIAVAAAKQSGRGIIPSVHDPVLLVDAITMAKKSDLSLIPYEKEKERKLKDVLKAQSVKDVSVFIGPEGGFSEEEISIAVENGVLPVTLGNRIFRTETASIYMTSIIIYELD
ncbi:MAG: 16S rRNA (uracil(1498)-N(3))-methyltransferase [Clostridiales bacterium]|nr:16S rRNA (uracil(1498)-N(3))-methyltransferase [Clostridiales bacterium]